MLVSPASLSVLGDAHKLLAARAAPRIATMNYGEAIAILVEDAYLGN